MLCAPTRQSKFLKTWEQLILDVRGQWQHSMHVLVMTPSLSTAKCKAVQLAASSDAKGAHTHVRAQCTHSSLWTDHDRCTVRGPREKQWPRALTHHEERARVLDREVQGGAFADATVVHVACDAGTQRLQEGQWDRTSACLYQGRSVLSQVTCQEYLPHF